MFKAAVAIKTIFTINTNTYKVAINYSTIIFQSCVFKTSSLGIIALVFDIRLIMQTCKNYKIVRFEALVELLLTLSLKAFLAVYYYICTKG